MTPPKTFTGPEGYTFTISADGTAVGIDPPHLYGRGPWVPLAELRAFVDSITETPVTWSVFDEAISQADAAILARAEHAGNLKSLCTTHGLWECTDCNWVDGRRQARARPAVGHTTGDYEPGALPHVVQARANAEHLIARDGWCRKCGWDSNDARCPAEHPSECDGIT